MQENNPKPYGTVLIKAAKILDCLADTTGDITLKQIADLSGLTTSTALKILDTLMLIGYVTRNEKNKTYFLGPGLVKYSQVYSTNSMLKNIAEPSLEKLQSEVDETIHLGMSNNDELIYIDKLEPKEKSIYMSSKVGASKPLYSTGMGKVFLSAYGDEELANYFEKVQLKAYTENTITNQFLMKKELQKIKETNIAYDDEEMEEDCYCIAMPIKNRQGKLEGAFSVSMPKFRANEEMIHSVIEKMATAKKTIEDNMN
ncbi:IclR family transcriptional regulator [Vagococcus sp. JNUCC 83]